MHIDKNFVNALEFQCPFIDRLDHKYPIYLSKRKWYSILKIISRHSWKDGYKLNRQ